MRKNAAGTRITERDENAAYLIKTASISCQKKTTDIFRNLVERSLFQDDQLAFHVITSPCKKEKLSCVNCPKHLHHSNLEKQRGTHRSCPFWIFKTVSSLKRIAFVYLLHKIIRRKAGIIFDLGVPTWLWPWNFTRRVNAAQRFEYELLKDF